MLREKLAKGWLATPLRNFTVESTYRARYFSIFFLFLSFFPNEPRSPPSRTTEQTKIGKKLKRDIEESKQDVQESIKERERKRSDSV